MMRPVTLAFRRISYVDPPPPERSFPVCVCPPINGAITIQFKNERLMRHNVRINQLLERVRSIRSRLTSIDGHCRL